MRMRILQQEGGRRRGEYRLVNSLSLVVSYLAYSPFFFLPLIKLLTHLII